MYIHTYKESTQSLLWGIYVFTYHRVPSNAYCHKSYQFSGCSFSADVSGVMMAMPMCLCMSVCLYIRTRSATMSVSSVSIIICMSYVCRLIAHSPGCFIIFFSFLFTALVLLLLFRVLRVSFVGCPARSPAYRPSSQRNTTRIVYCQGGTRIDTYSHVRPYAATRDMNHTLSVRRRFRLWPLYVFLSRFYCCCRYTDGAVADTLWQ